MLNPLEILRRPIEAPLVDRQGIHTRSGRAGIILHPSGIEIVAGPDPLESDLEGPATATLVLRPCGSRDPSCSDDANANGETVRGPMVARPARPTHRRASPTPFLGLCSQPLAVPMRRGSGPSQGACFSTRCPCAAAPRRGGGALGAGCLARSAANPRSDGTPAPRPDLQCDALTHNSWPPALYKRASPSPSAFYAKSYKAQRRSCDSHPRCYRTSTASSPPGARIRAEGQQTAPVISVFRPYRPCP